MTPLDFISPILAGALLNLDRQAFGPFMVCRPLTTGLIMGLVLNEAWAGVWLGLSVELLWLALPPLGGQIPPNAGLAVSSVLTGWALSPFADCLAGKNSCGLVLAFLLVPCWALALTWLEKYSRVRAARRAVRVETRLENGGEPHFFRENLYGLWWTLALAVAALAVAVPLNWRLFSFLAARSPFWVFESLRPLLTFIPFLGLVAMAVFTERKSVTFYLAGLGASLLALSAA